MSGIVERILKRRAEKRQIKCPHCGRIQPNDDCQYPVSYWGDDGVIEWECIECEKKFYVEEYVERTYVVGKNLDKFGYVIESETEDL